MDNLATPAVITAIADPDFEGVVSSTLFGQGWSVIARTLDMNSLEIEIAKCDVSQVILIYSSDLPGISLARLQELNRSGITLFGFTDAAGSAQGLPEISPRPTSSVELLAYIRGNIRSPQLRAPLLQPTPNLKARIIGVGSASHSTGNTVLALNLAQESAILGLKTLLIDANFQAPAIATLLDLRKVSDENKWRDISENLSISEITQQKAALFNALAIDAAAHFDLIYIDLGMLANLSSDLTDRRWASQVKIWVANLAQNIIITSTTEILQQRRLKDLQQDLSKISITPNISLAVLSASDYRKRDSTTLTSSYQMSHIWEIPFDARACSLAMRERTTLAHVSAKCRLRKAFLNIATQIT
jgi:hypothetical protein